MHSYEIEIKSLLGSSEHAEKLRQKMKEVDSQTALLSRHKQLNHYFTAGDVKKLAPLVAQKLSKKNRKELQTMIEKGSEFSVRTREADGDVLLVVKASIDEGTSSNTVSRIEFEAPVPITLDALDRLVLDAGFSYQAKWSREREEYVCKGAHVCIDRNAGYGYVAEFEKVIDNETDTKRAKEELHRLMKLLNAEELPQDRLERMFAHYNAHWQEYYGTDKVFVIK
ncbi:hypothetical protein HYW58_02620 [Candidatus Kaiserbacteria bacterium]|nr:hypothetical protein [Candidatus Kaiserbacteria bacterium]